MAKTGGALYLFRDTTRAWWRPAVLVRDTTNFIVVETGGNLKAYLFREAIYAMAKTGGELYLFRDTTSIVVKTGGTKTNLYCPWRHSFIVVKIGGTQQNKNIYIGI